MVKNYPDSKLIDVDPNKEKGVLKKVLVEGWYELVQFYELSRKFCELTDQKVL